MRPETDEEIIRRFFNESQDEILATVGFPSTVLIQPTYNEVIIKGPKSTMKWPMDEMLAMLRKQDNQ